MGPCELKRGLLRTRPISCGGGGAAGGSEVEGLRARLQLIGAPRRAQRRRVCASTAGLRVGGGRSVGSADASRRAALVRWAGRITERGGATGADLLEPHRVAGGLADGERARKTEA